MAKKIQSFEEYSASQGLGDKSEVSEEELDDCPCGHDEDGNCKECEEGGEPAPDAEDEIEDEDDEESEDDSDDDGSDDDDSDDSDDDGDSDDDDSDDTEAEDNGEEVEAEAKTVATVEEMLSGGYAAVKEAACAYEKDDYQDHTLESYMKENAALVAALSVKAGEDGYKEVKEGEITKEMYEALCNEIKEAFVKKIDELKETWGAGEE